MNGESFPENQFAAITFAAPTFILMPAQGPGRGDLCLRHRGLIWGYPGPEFFERLLEPAEQFCAEPE